MARQLQLRRGTTAQHAVFTGAIGEVTIDTDKDALVVHDGVQAGGFPAARESVVTAHTGNTSNPHNVTKTQVGLGNVNNTSDANKPVSTATQTALNLKANLASPTFTGTPIAPTASVGTNTTQVATTAFVNAEIANDTYSKSQIDTALGLKADTSYVNSQLGLKQNVLVANDPAVKTALNASGTAPIYACRAWVNFNGTGTVAIRASGNVSSITDNGIGDYTVNFTVALQDANYSTTGSVSDVSGSGTSVCLITSLTTSVRISTDTYQVGNDDRDFISLQIAR